MLSRAPDVIVMNDDRVRAVPVVDSVDDPLVAIAHEVVTAVPRGPHHLRRSVLRRLVVAADALDPELTLCLYEGWRDPAAQESYFAKQVARLAGDYPAFTDSELAHAASRFVAPPDVAPHPTGAAVDVVLLGPDGSQVDVGCEINTNPEDSHGLCYTNHPDVPPTAKSAREALVAAMSGAGFVNYPTEWWHFSYGDRYWAMTTGAEAAIFGAAKIF